MQMPKMSILWSLSRVLLGDLSQGGASVAPKNNTKTFQSYYHTSLGYLLRYTVHSYIPPTNLPIFSNNKGQNKLGESSLSVAYFELKDSIFENQHCKQRLDFFRFKKE